MFMCFVFDPFIQTFSFGVFDFQVLGILSCCTWSSACGSMQGSPQSYNTKVNQNVWVPPPNNQKRFGGWKNLIVVWKAKEVWRTCTHLESDKVKRVHSSRF